MSSLLGPEPEPQASVQPPRSGAAEARNHHRHLRGVLLADGTTINCFRKNTHETHTIVLERSGHTYTYIHPDGSQTRHLSPTALSSHRAMVVETVNLRNRFAWQTSSSSTNLAPYVHRALCQPQEPENGEPSQLVRSQRRHSSSRVLRARWSVGTFYTRTLFDVSKQRFEIRSIEGNARVCLHPSATLVDVFYVVQVKTSVEMGEDSDHRHAYYSTIQQTFTVHHTPPCFGYPVRVLLHAHSAYSSKLPEFEYALQENESAFSDLPGNAAFSARPSFPALSTSHTNGDADRDGLVLADVLRVASLPTKKLYERVVVEVKDDATFHFCRPGGAIMPSIVVQLADQDAVIECAGGFFRWYGENGQLQQQFTMETIPPASFFATANPSTSVLSLCNHVMHLLASSGNTTTVTSDISSADAESLVSSEVVERVETEQGRFRAFADGRVRVAFQDRTILQVDRDQVLCSFFFADGSSGQTTVSAAPASQQVYIHRALEFADWAFASPRERMLRYMRRQLNQEVAHQEIHKIGVRYEMNHAQEIETTGIRGGRMAAQTTTQDGNDSMNETDHYLTLPMIKQLQEATQQHIASVNRLLHTTTTESNL